MSKEHNADSDSDVPAKPRSVLAVAQRVRAMPRPAGTAAPRLPAICFQLRRADLLRLAWVHPWSRRLLYVVTLATFRATHGTSKAAIAALAAALAWAGIRMDAWAFALLVVVLVWTLPILFAKGLALRILARKLAPCALGSDCRIEVAGEGLQFECDGAAGLIAWSAIKAIQQSRPLLLVRHTEGDLLLPSRAFDDDHQRENLLALLALRTGQSPQWVYLPGFGGGERG